MLEREADKEYLIHINYVTHFKNNVTICGKIKMLWNKEVWHSKSRASDEKLLLVVAYIGLPFIMKLKFQIPKNWCLKDLNYHFNHKLKVAVDVATKYHYTLYIAITLMIWKPWKA